MLGKAINNEEKRPAGCRRSNRALLESDSDSAEARRCDGQVWRTTDVVTRVRRVFDRRENLDSFEFVRRKSVEREITTQRERIEIVLELRAGRASLHRERHLRKRSEKALKCELMTRYLRN